MGKTAKPIQPLTAAQREFAEQNIKLLYCFLHSRHLDFDEWHGVAAVGFLKAVATFNPSQIGRAHV